MPLHEKLPKCPPQQNEEQQVQRQWQPKDTIVPYYNTVQVEDIFDIALAPVDAKALAKAPATVLLHQLEPVVSSC